MRQRAEVTPKPKRLATAADFLKSGKTMLAWSKERQMNRFTLHNWVEEYRHENESAEQSRDWLEVSVSGAMEEIQPVTEAKPNLTLVKTTYQPIRITVGKAQIEVTTGFDESALAAIIRAVGS